MGQPDGESSKQGYKGRILTIVLLLTLLGCTPQTAHAAEAWTVVGKMSVGRAYHTATLLGSGQVLVTGGEGDIGYYGIGSLNSAELFDSDEGTWTRVAPMRAIRHHHTATLLTDGPHAGNIVVIGGRGDSFPQGQRHSDYHSSVERYDPTTRTWTDAGALTTPRYGHTTVLLSSGPNAGKLLIMGGQQDKDTRLASAELYDPVAMTAQRVASMSIMRTLAAAVVMRDGRVFVAGGHDNSPGPFLANTEVYDPVSNSWSPTAVARSGFGTQQAVLLPDDRVLVGLNDIYDPRSDAWSSTGERNERFFLEPSMVLTANNQVLAFGLTRYTSNGLVQAERYDPSRSRWYPAALPLVPCSLLHPGQKWGAATEIRASMTLRGRLSPILAPLGPIPDPAARN